MGERNWGEFRAERGVALNHHFSTGLSGSSDRVAGSENCREASATKNEMRDLLWGVGYGVLN